MAHAKTKEIFNAPIEKVFQVIADCSKYPEFLTDVKRVSVIDTKNERKLVEFEVNVIKSFRYQVWMTEKPNSELSWTFHSGEMFKDNSGSWLLKDLGGGKTEVQYEVSAKFGMFVPGMIEKKLIEVNLPSMMRAYKERVEKS